MGFEWWPGWPGEWVKSGLKIQAKELLENLSENDMSDYTTVIKDSTRPIECKTDAIKKLHEHPNGIKWLKDFLTSNNENYKIEDKILIMKTCVEESDYFRDWLKNEMETWALSHIIKNFESILELNNENIRIEYKILIIEIWLQMSDNFKDWLGKDLEIWNFPWITNFCKENLENENIDIEYKILLIKIWELISNNFHSWLLDFVEQHDENYKSDYDNYIKQVQALEDFIKTEEKRNKLRNEISEIRSNLNNIDGELTDLEEKLRRYNEDDTMITKINKVKVGKEKDKEELNKKLEKARSELKNIIKGTKPESKKIEVHIKETKNSLKENVKKCKAKYESKLAILPESYLIRCLLSRDNKNNIEWIWNEVFLALSEWFEESGWKNIDVLDNANIQESKNIKLILENFNWKKSEIESKKTEIRDAKKIYERILFNQDDIDENNPNFSDIKEMTDILTWLKSQWNIAKKLNGCHDIESCFKIMNIEFTDTYRKIFIDNDFWIWNDGSASKELKTHRLNAIKTYFLNIYNDKNFNVKNLEEYIYKKVFSIQYEYSDSENKKKLIKNFLEKKKIDLVNRNMNTISWENFKSGLKIDDFLDVFYEETNEAFAQNLQKWNNGEISNYWLKSDIIEAIMKIAIKKAKKNPTCENIFNILQAPICHVNWNDFWFIFSENIYNRYYKNGKDGKRIENVNDNFFNNIEEYILRSSKSSTREFNRWAHDKHTGVYKDNDVIMIWINDLNRFFLEGTYPYFTIVDIKWHNDDKNYSESIKEQKKANKKNKKKNNCNNNKHAA